MRTKQLFISILVAGLCVSTAFAQMANEDITPSKFKFVEKAVGPYKTFVDKSSSGANPANGDADVKTYFEQRGGFVDTGNGQFAAGLVFGETFVAKQDSNLRNTMQIIDLGGEIGKVFVLKGVNSTFEDGINPTSGIAPTWYNIHMYSDPAKTTSVAALTEGGMAEVEAAAKATIRMKLVLHIHSNTKVTSKTFSILGYTSEGAAKLKADGVTLDHSADISSANFYDSVFDEETEENIDTYNPTKWRVIEYDMKANSKLGSPLRFSMQFGGNQNNQTILFKEISFVSNPTAPITPDNTYITLNRGVNSVQNRTAAALRVSTANGFVTVYDVNSGNSIRIYNAAGQLVKEAISQGDATSISLGKGFYVVRVGTRSSKVAI